MTTDEILHMPIPSSHFTMRTVESSMIAEIGYYSDFCLMRVRFKPREGDLVGPLYQYGNVTPDLWERLLAADSIGKEYTRLVKKNPHIPFVRVDESEVSR